MKDYKEMDNLIFEFGKDTNHFASTYAGKMPPAIKSQLQDLMFTGFAKEIEAIQQREELEIKYKKKFYDKLLRTKRKLVNKDRADAWFDKIFQKYFNKGILEHLIVYAIRFLYRNELFVPKRLFSQINNDELLAQFTLSAIEYLGWNAQNDGTEPPITDETKTIDEEQDEDETSADDEEAPKDEECTDVTVYEPKEVQPVEPQQQPVVKVERTVTHEVLTTTGTPPNEPPVTSDSVDEGTDENSDTPPAISAQKEQPHFYRPGGKNGKK